MRPQLVIGEHAFLRQDLAATFESRARSELEAAGRFSVVLAGGSIAPEFFPPLAALPLDWRRIDFFWADERAVAPDDPESNYAAASAHWLDPARVPPARVHRMRAEDPDLQRAARDYSDVLEMVAGRPPRLDFALLGLGPDGHIASLFPGHPLLQERARLVAVVEDSPKPPRQRLTMTLAALGRVDLAVVAALGEAKAQAVHDSLEPGSSLPLALLAACVGDVRLLLDNGAARLLPKR